MRVLGIETSCDETGVAIFDTDRGLVADALHSQAAMHAAYGGVVPELASRDHVRRLVPLVDEVLERAQCGVDSIDLVAYTRGPGLAGALLVGASFASGLAFALGKPAIGIHHLEGHLLSPLIGEPSLGFPFVALLVSGGHTQLFEVRGVGRYRLLGETQDDAAGEAFDKTAKLLGLPYPGGPALAALARRGRAGALELPRPMIDSGDLDFSFSGLKTAVALRARAAAGDAEPSALDEGVRADLARAFEDAAIDVLAAKAFAALDATSRATLVVAGGVGANRRLRERLAEKARRCGATVHFPEPRYCTDNGAMIAFAGALRAADATSAGPFDVLPRWELATLAEPGQTFRAPGRASVEPGRACAEPDRPPAEQADPSAERARSSIDAAQR